MLRPVAVDETEIRHVALGMDGGPEIANRERLRIQIEAGDIQAARAQTAAQVPWGTDT